MDALHLDNHVPADLKPLIVVVEDDLSLLAAMTFALQADGFRVLAYSGGNELFSAPLGSDPDCLVVDLKLEGLDGLEVIRRLRADGVTAPAILITSHPSERVQREAVGAGVEIVEKPILDNSLRRRIDAAVQRRI